MKIRHVNLREWAAHMAFMTPPVMGDDEKIERLEEERAQLVGRAPSSSRFVFVAGNMYRVRHVGNRLAEIERGLARLCGSAGRA